MKYSIVFAIFSLFSLSAFATNVVTLDFRVAVLQSKIGQEAAKEPREKVAKMEQQLNAAKTELDEKTANLKRDELTLDPETFKQRREVLAKRDAELRGAATNMQRQAQKLEKELLAKLTPNAEAILKLIIQEKKIDLVINRQLSLYAGPNIDITNELTKRLDESN
ncbi:outer membrane chaperone Skp [Marinomonas sp. S3726]|uniref:OmpH family outer membrane protein n=1 Tax=Marinomonas sp. S3726 TaxID=579484 RepID=UPI0005F9FBA8|nr:OmpH family outer membrane protein [Marinomonas sp. S3726]KJZ11037.1 outer membrane chaperone Skp [Marinomonas sp. S3726]